MDGASTSLEYKAAASTVMCFLPSLHGGGLSQLSLINERHLCQENSSLKLSTFDNMQVYFP